MHYRLEHCSCTSNNHVQGMAVATFYLQLHERALQHDHAGDIAYALNPSEVGRLLSKVLRNDLFTHMHFIEPMRVSVLEQYIVISMERPSPRLGS